MRKIIIIFVVIFCIINFRNFTYAQLKNSSISIDADKAIYLQAKNKIKFFGKVLAQGKEFKIRCDEMELILKKNINESVKTKNNKDVIKKIIAIGNVHIMMQDKEGFCKRAEYDLKKEKIVLIDDVRLVQGKNEIQGNKLIIDLKTNKSEIFSSKTSRVKIIFFPEKFSVEFSNKIPNRI